MTSRLNRIVAVLLAAASITAIVGCGSDDNATSASTSTAGASATKGTVHVGVISDLTGQLAPYTGVEGSLAYVDALNAAGGLDGYKIKIDKYDSASTPAGSLQAVRKAIGDKPAAILSSGSLMTSALPTLAKSGIPAIGEGFSAGWIGHPTLFSPVGDVTGHLSDVWLQALKKEGVTKVAILSAPTQRGNQLLMSQEAPGVGLTVVMKDNALPLQPSAADSLRLAQRVKASGADGVLIFAVGGTPLQANLNQLGAKVTVLETTDFGPAVLKQFGARVNGMLFAGVFASSYASQAPGVSAYGAAMKDHGYQKAATNPYALLRYAQAKFLFEQGLKPAGAPFKPTAITAKLATVKDYTGGGLLPKTTFPDYQTAGARCISVSKVENGTWVATSNGAFPFVCGGPSKPVPN